MQNLDHNIGFWEKRHFFVENCQKSQKIVIVTSTPDLQVSWTDVCRLVAKKNGLSEAANSVKLNKLNK
jgi:hypothetical protein